MRESRMRLVGWSRAAWEDGGRGRRRGGDPGVPKELGCKDRGLRECFGTLAVEMGRSARSLRSRSRNAHLGSHCVGRASPMASLAEKMKSFLFPAGVHDRPGDPFLGLKGSARRRVRASARVGRHRREEKLKQAKWKSGSS